MRELERKSNANQGDVATLAIIGAGRVGGAVHRAATAAGIATRLSGRSDAAAACEGADAALLCVPDSAIEEACATAAATGSLRFVGHTSGATGLDALSAAEASGGATFGLHPLQTIPDADAPLAGAPCAIGGSTPAALVYAGRLARRLGMEPFEIDDSSRAAYHAAASIASNFLVALGESAARLLERTGVEDGREMLAPLVLRSAANWSERGGEALTGPIARGDEDTVRRHLEAIEAELPELAELYRALAARTRALAAADGVTA